MIINDTSLISLQQVLPPILMAQMGKKWEVVELLTEKYGCSINLPLLSFQVYLFIVVLVYAVCFQLLFYHLSKLK